MSKPTPDSFAGRLNDLLISKHMAPIELARAVGVSSMAVSNWRAGKTYPRDAALAQIASVLDVTPSFLLDGPEPREVSEPRGESVSDLISKLRHAVAAQLGVNPAAVSVNFSIN